MSSSRVDEAQQKQSKWSKWNQGLPGWGLAGRGAAGLSEEGLEFFILHLHGEEVREKQNQDARFDGWGSWVAGGPGPG